MCGGKILKPCFGLSGYSAEKAIGQLLTLIIPSQLHQRHDTGMERMNQRKKPRVIGKVLELKAKKARKNSPLRVLLEAGTTMAKDIIAVLSGILPKRKNRMNYC